MADVLGGGLGGGPGRGAQHAARRAGSVVTAALAPAGAAAGQVTGGVRLLLRLEGLMVLAVAVAAYANFGAGWGFFGALFLLPDLALIVYLAGPRAGAAAYNATHSYIGPLALLAAAVLGALPMLLTAALIWCAHIGFDRALGYGLKYPSGFGQTHLRWLGRADPW